MTTRPRRPVARLFLVGAALAARATAFGATQDPASELKTILERVAAYVDGYERDLTAVVSDEEYLQRFANDRSRRVLRSEYLVLPQPTYGWVAFRDVYELDGRPIRDREHRLTGLMLHPRADALQQARRIADESARFNLNPPAGRISRTINSPYTALRFARPAFQSRSDFTLGPAAGGTRLLTFKERAKPRLIATPDDAASQGTFTIDPATGRVLASTLRIRTGAVASTIRAEYAADAKTGLWLAVKMDEEYSYRGDILEGHATYSNFRKFDVTTSTDIKH